MFDLDNEEKLDDEAMNVLKNSKRKYENIEFRSITFGYPAFYREILAKGAGSWKSVTISFCTLKDDDSWLTIFSIIESSVEELSIKFNHFLYAPETTAFRTKLTFPRLKILEFSNNTSKAYKVYKYFVCCKNLVRLRWYADTLGKSMSDSLLTILRSNHNLEDVEVKPEVRTLERRGTSLNFPRVAVNTSLFNL